MGYTGENEAVWDTLAGEGDDWTLPIAPEAYRAAKEGDLSLYLTPAKTVPRKWFPPLAGARVLGLASGGGQQGPVFAAHGAAVTIMDLSGRQLDAERLVADREGYAISLVKADMTEPFPFPENSFDLIFHPVSNCYIEDIRPVWKECYRVLRPGGVLLSGFIKEELFLFEFDWQRDPPLAVTHPLPFNPLRDPAARERAKDSQVTRGVSFSHTLEEQIGGQLQAGFLLTGIYDDRDRGGIFARYLNTYAATRAVKPRRGLLSI